MLNETKVALRFTDIRRRVKALAAELPPVDLVIGVATGGVVPASLLAYELDQPLAIVHINYRAEDNRPQHPAPELLGAQALPAGQRVLLVDDVSVSGQTLELARSLLADRQVMTFVLKGHGDFVAFPEVGACVFWPWKLS